MMTMIMIMGDDDDDGDGDDNGIDTLTMDTQKVLNKDV